MYFIYLKTVTKGNADWKIHAHLCFLLSGYRCPEYWKERLQRERKQQLKLAKQCYDEQLEVLLGLRNSMISF